MDELTLDQQKYLSSKRAAQITGYAKDYVGQLCREGRVKARLVGRNWYVLESSILEHRFGAEESQNDTQEAVQPLGRSWEPATYISERVDMVPDLAPKMPLVAVIPEPIPEITAVPAPKAEIDELAENIAINRMGPETENATPFSYNDINPINVSTPHFPQDNAEKPSVLNDKNSTWEESPILEAQTSEVVEKANVLADMQSAWQEWFQKQQEGEKSLRDGSDMLLEGPEVPLQSPRPAESRDGSEAIHIDRIAIPAARTQVREVVEQRASAPVTVRRSSVRPHINVVSPGRASYGNPIRPTNAPLAPEKRSSNGILRALLLSVAGLAIVVAVIGTGAADRFFDAGGVAAPLTNYFGGVHVIEK